jgi:hypothetical protein
MSLFKRLFGSASENEAQPSSEPQPKSGSGKNFHLSVEQIKPIAEGYGGCIATDMIMIDGYKVRYMDRTEPVDPEDSGWGFRSGLEDQAYMNDASNHGIYDVNELANYDPSIKSFLDAPIGSSFVWDESAASFVAEAQSSPFVVKESQ